MEKENKRRSYLDDGTKQAIKQMWNIDVDGEIMSPLVDYVFKRIFTADEANSKTALIHFINSILAHENDDKIVDLTIVNPQIPVDRGAEKKSIFDIRAKYNNGRQAVIEMQKDPTPGFSKRSQHIISKTYAAQEISGLDYDKLEKCYLICITNFGIIKEAGEYIKDYRYRDRQGKDLTDGQTIVFLDLSKIDGVLKKKVEEMTNVERWAVFFKYASDDSKQKLLDEILEKEEGIKMATNILIQVSKEEEARAYYESELRFELDQSSKMNHAIRKAKAEMAKNLIEMGLSNAQISKATDFLLSEEEIEALRA